MDAEELAVILEKVGLEVHPRKIAQIFQTLDPQAGLHTSRLPASLTEYSARFGLAKIT